MYLKLIRNQAKGSAITSRLVIDGRWFCNTLERVGYQIPALCYHVAVTQSPKFKRLLPIVQNVPQRSGIRFHRGTKPEHSTGCILVLADNINNNTDNLRGRSINDNTDNLRGNQLPAALKENTPCRSRDVDSSGTLSKLSSNKNIVDIVENNIVNIVDKNNPSRSRELIRAEVVDVVVNNKISVGGRSAADVENQLTQLLLQAQQAHEEIILEVIDFTPGTQYGYDHPCPSSECACEKEIRSAHFARRHSSSILVPTRHSDDF